MRAFFFRMPPDKDIGQATLTWSTAATAAGSDHELGNGWSVGRVAPLSLGCEGARVFQAS